MEGTRLVIGYQTGKVEKTKNEMEGYGQTGSLNGCNKLQSLTHKERRRKVYRP
jgi:hypothetical protein